MPNKPVCSSDSYSSSLFYLKLLQSRLQRIFTLQSLNRREAEVLSVC